MSRTRESIIRLINHPATPEAERNAAKLALQRIDGLDAAISLLDKEKERITNNLGTIFKRRMRSTL